MNQDFRGAKITSGSGGNGARGGDIGSYNTSSIKHTNSHNDNSVRQRFDGDNYIDPVDQGEKYDSPSEAELMEKRVEEMRQRLATKKELERLKKSEEELRELEAELAA